MEKIKVIVFASLVLGFASSSWSKENVQYDVEATWCREELAGGYINETTFHEVWICSANESTANYKKLCFTSSELHDTKYFSALQYNSMRPYSGMWRTSTSTDNSESEIEFGDNYLRFASDQSVLLGANTISEMIVNFNSSSVTANVYEKRFFKNRLLDSETYSCVSH